MMAQAAPPSSVAFGPPDGRVQDAEIVRAQDCVEAECRVEVGHLPDPQVGRSFAHQRGWMREHLDPRSPQDERSPTTARQQRHHVPIRVARTQQGESGVVGEHAVRAQYGTYQVGVGARWKTRQLYAGRAQRLYASIHSAPAGGGLGSGRSRIGILWRFDPR